MTDSPPTRPKFFTRALNLIERVGNALPHPATLFAILGLVVLVASALAAALGANAVHPSTGELIVPRNLLGFEGLRYLYVSLEDNFIAFPPFGIVLVSVIGLGIAEGTGLIEALIKQTILKAPRRLVTSFIIAAGILSHLASSVGYVVLIPLGALVFMAFRRHPVAGIAAAFAGVSGGFGANFLIGSIDPILSGLSESAAQIVQPDLSVGPAANYYFMVASAFMIVLVGTWVTERIVEPRLGAYQEEHEAPTALTAMERRGLRAALITLALLVAAFVGLPVPEGAVPPGGLGPRSDRWAGSGCRAGGARGPRGARGHGAPRVAAGPDHPGAGRGRRRRAHGTRGAVLRGSGSVLDGPFFEGLITGIFLFFSLPGLVYGLTTGKIRSDKDVVTLITQAIRDIAPYVVLVFFAAQFIAWFQESRLGLLLAIHGAAGIQASGISGPALLVLFIVFSAVMNFFMGSASAKWAIMAPVFVPMFMLSGYHPALTQAAFRIGDSVTNIITPMMSYYALILTFVNKFDRKAGVGTTIAMMLPYSVFFFLAWTVLLLVWYYLGIPLGPGGPVHM